MYFPKKFDRKLSIELGNLIIEAYAQFSAFEKGQRWELSKNYTLLHEITYNWKPGQKADEPTLDEGLSRQEKLDPKKKKDILMPLGFIAERKGTLFLIFRGTLTTREWMRNLSFNLKDYQLEGHGKAHDGFIQIYRLARETIMNFLLKQDKKSRLYVAGHSLGGALATMVAPDIEASTGLKVKSVYTFGSPRVGDNAFVAAYNRNFAARTFRINNTSDIVPSIPLPVPFGILAGGYFSHVDTPVDCTVQGSDIEFNHKMETYISALRNAEPESFIRRLLARMKH